MNADTPTQDELRKDLRWIAWATKSASNGRITRWSRWHAVKVIRDGEVTMCGMVVPHTKIETDHHFTSMINGGDCSECRASARRRKNQVTEQRI